jgi:hypothetical protein
LLGYQRCCNNTYILLHVLLSSHDSRPAKLHPQLCGTIVEIEGECRHAWLLLLLLVVLLLMVLLLMVLLVLVLLWLVRGHELRPR